MPREIDADYSQQFLLPPNLEDWIPSDHPARFIRLFVDSLKLRDLGFKVRESEEGRPNYSNELLLKIWLYGYFHKIKSSRELERACKNEMPLIWLSGINYPDHNTLWRFFRNNRSCLKGVFKQTVQFAVKSKMVGFALQAVDGTKVEADASKDRSLHKKSLEKLLSSLDKLLEERLLEIEKRDDMESSLPSYSLPKELQDPKKLKDFIEKGLDSYSTKDKIKLRSTVYSSLEALESAGTSHLNLTDEESRMMKNASHIKFSYNAQGIVDEKEQIIVGSKVSHEENDSHHLTEMLDEAKENTGEVSQETVADGGYFSGEELQKSNEKDYSVLVNMLPSVGTYPSDRSSDFGKDNFKYDRTKDQYICPLGNPLLYERTIRRKKRRYKVRVYRCKSFRECPHREQCSKDPRGRSVERSPYEDVIKKQTLKQKEPENKKLLLKRKKIVEPVFGWIKHNHGFKRWSYRGLKSVNAQWNLVCATINLKKLYKKWLNGDLNFS